MSVQVYQPFCRRFQSADWITDCLAFITDIGIAGLNILILTVAYLLGTTNMCQWRDTEHYVSTVLNRVSLADVHAASVVKTVVKVIKKRNYQTIRVYQYGLAISRMKTGQLTNIERI